MARSRKYDGTGNAMRIRQFKACQFEYNPRTGEKLADLTQIANNLTKYKSLTYWSWCIHDKDVYTQDAIDDMNFVLEQEAKQAGLKDENAIAEYVSQNAWGKLGEPKGRHIHICCQMKSAFEIYKISNWLGIPEHLIIKTTGKGALLDCTQYLTHECSDQQELGKYRYDDSEVHTSSNFSDWREQLDSRKDDEAKYGEGKSIVDKFIIDVKDCGKTLRECEKEMDGNDYVNNLRKLQIARAEYLDKRAELPNTRINFYVYGDGGIGKGVLCELMARILCSDKDDIRDIIFGIGDGNSTFDGYDGQPVLLWQDMRAVDFISAIGRKSTLKTLDIHPRLGDGNVDVKFGKTKLIHEFNIINGIDPYEKFMNELAGEYKDKQGNEHHAETKNLEQFYRRFPVIIPVSEEKFDILINIGVFMGTREYEQYKSYASMVGSFARLQELCGANQGLLIDMSKPMVDPIKEVSDYLKQKLDTPQLTEEEIRYETARLGYGRRINGDVIIAGLNDNQDESVPEPPQMTMFDGRPAFADEQADETFDEDDDGGIPF